MKFKEAISKKMIIIIGLSVSMISCNDLSPTITDEKGITIADALGSSYDPPAKSVKEINEDYIIKYIQLETTDESVFRTVMSVIRIDEGILITDGESLLLFDHIGNFIWKVFNKGRGPGEYSGVGDVDVDRWRREIILTCSETARHFIYDYNGNLIEEMNLSPAKGFYLTVLDSGTYLLQTGTNKNDPWAWVVTRGGKIIQSFTEPNFPQRIYDNGRGSSYIAQRRIGEFKDGYYLWQSDTIWSLDNSLVKKNVLLTIDPRIVTLEEVVFDPIYQRPINVRGAKDRHYLYEVGTHGKSYLLLSLFFRKRIILFNPDENALYDYPEGGYTDDIDNGPAFYGLPEYNKPHLSVIFPFELKKLNPDKFRKGSHLYEIYHGVKADDNPIIRVLTSKSSEERGN